MANTSEDEELDSEHGTILWLTSQILDEAFATKAKEMNRHQKQQHQQNSSKTQEASLSTAKHSRSHSRPKVSTTRASGGPGMQAIFIDSGQRSSGGTGVFLPQRSTGITYQPSKKPVCAPVLIPARVVQALNLNVHALGLQISRRQERKNYPNCRGLEHSKRKESTGGDLVVHSCRSSPKQSSPELLLPKEWTYK